MLLRNKGVYVWLNHELARFWCIFLLCKIQKPEGKGLKIRQPDWSVVPMDRTRGNRYVLKHTKFHPNTRMKVVEILKTQLDLVLSLSRGAGLEDLKTSLPT